MALAIVVTCLVVTADPASAATITATAGGNMTVHNTTSTSTDTISGSSGTGGTGCGNTFVITTTPVTTGTSVTWNITTFSRVNRFVLGGVHYIEEITRTASTAGTVSSGTTNWSLNTATLTLQVIVANATNQSSTATDCLKTTTKCRFNTVNLSLTGTYTGNIHSPAVSDTFAITGSGTLGTVFPGCTAPFTTYSGGTATFATHSGHVTGVV
jgi:hypothetical protein